MEEKNETKILSPKLDVVFQRLFGEVGSERITKRFLENILEKEIDSIELDRSPILKRDLKDEKLGVLDIIAELNGNENCNIEMQIIGKDNIKERLLFYWSKLYSKGIKKGEDYKELKKTIVILIADFELEGLEKIDYHSKWKIIEEKERRATLTDKLEIDIIELPKIKGKENRTEELLDWLYFLENPESERVREKMKENEELQEANEKLRNISEDEYLQRLADLREKAILDEKATYSLGVKEGIKEGIKQNQVEMVKKMIEEKIGIDTIMKISGLTQQEIKKIECGKN